MSGSAGNPRELERIVDQLSSELIGKDLSYPDLVALVEDRVPSPYQRSALVLLKQSRAVTMSEQPTIQPWQVGVGVMGVAMLVGVFVVAWLADCPNPFQFWVSRVMISLAAGLIAAFITGFVKLDVKWKGFALNAGGGLAVMALVYLWNPQEIAVDYTCGPESGVEQPTG